MPLLIQYLIKLSISLSLVYLFYQLWLRRLTYYNWNRWYLLGYSLLSFVIPFVNITPWVEHKNLDEVRIIHYIPVIENYTVGSAANPSPLPAHSFDVWDIGLMVLLLGVIAMIARLLVQYVSLQKIKRNAVVVNEGGPVIYHVEENIIPFSFGNSIYINQNLHTEKEFSEIILHEYVHVRQKHTVDILLAELFCMLNWYNPFAWLIRHAIRQNLEFIADHDVLQSGLDKKAYQYHLLKVVGLPQYRIANSFNFSSLKKRIVMMNKFRSARIHLIKFLFVLPLLAVLLLAFRDKNRDDFKKTSAFEKLYGALPVVVPSAANNTVLKKDAASSAAPVSYGKDKLQIAANHTNFQINADTVPRKTDTSLKLYAYPGNTIYASGLSEDYTNGKFGDSILFVIDGTQIPVGINPGKLISPSFIQSIIVLKGASAVSKYGDNAESGVIEITTKDKNFQLQDLPVSEGDFPIKFKGIKNPLFFIDGKEASFAEVQKLKASEIGTVNMSPMVDMPGAAITEKGKDGIIYITTKKVYPPLTQAFKPVTPSLNGRRPNTNSVDVLPEFNLHPEPLYILDGREANPSAFKQLNPNDIESIDVLKGESAIKQYGEKGKNGVLVIKTKKKQSASAQPLNRSAANNGLFGESHFHTAGKFPDIILKNKPLQDTLIIVAAKIVYKGRSLQFSGSVKTVNQEISNADVTINIESNAKLPLIYFNGTEVQRIKNFKTHPGQYRLVSLHRQNAIEKYGDKGRNGAIEIASL